MKKLALAAMCLATQSFALTSHVTPPEGTLPLYVTDPVLPDRAGDPIGFACFGGCGRSCDCVGRVDAETTTHEDGHICSWQLTTCQTHSFCRWHDTCYRQCDFQVPGHVGDGSLKRNLCYRSCDEACVTGNDPQPLGGWNPASLDPGPPPESPGVLACIGRITGSSRLPYDGSLTFAQLKACVPDSTDAEATSAAGG